MHCLRRRTPPLGGKHLEALSNGFQLRYRHILSHAQPLGIMFGPGFHGVFQLVKQTDSFEHFSRFQWTGTLRLEKFTPDMNPAKQAMHFLLIYPAVPGKIIRYQCPAILFEKIFNMPTFPACRKFEVSPGTIPARHRGHP